MDAAWDGIVITAEQIIAHTNLFFAGLRYPDATSMVNRTQDVEFSHEPVG
jgi:hypothetical protein